MSRAKMEETPPRWNALLERSAWVVLALAVLFSLVVRVRLRDMPLERDEGEYAYAGQLLLQGVPPYQLAYNMKLPGTYVAYAAIMAALGQTPSGIHLGLAAVNVAGIVMMFFVGRRLLDPVTGAVGALCFALLTTSPALQGVAGHATHFVVLFALAGLLLLMRACERNQGGIFLLSGLMFGLALVMKQPGGTFGLFALVYAVWRSFNEGKLDWPNVLRQAGLVAAGWVLPFALTCVWLSWAGVFKAFVFWTIGYAREYVSAQPWSQLRENLHVSGSFTLYPTMAFWIVAGAGAVGMWWEPRLKEKFFFLTALIVASAAATGAGLYFRPHYFITFAPVLALLCGVAVSRSVQQLLHERSIELFTALATQFGFVLTLVVAFIVDGEAWFSQTPPEVSRAMNGSTIFSEAAVVADYVRANSDKDSRVGVIGSEPEIYFYSRRLSATGHIYMYGLMGSRSFARRMQDEMIEEIESAKPEWIVFVEDKFSWLESERSDRHIFDWWREYWTAHYELVQTVKILSRAIERDPAPGQPVSESATKPSGMFLILKRKS